MRFGGSVDCVGCGQRLSRYASKCPRCGTPQPHKRIGSSVGLVFLLLLLALAVIWAILE